MGVLSIGGERLEVPLGSMVFGPARTIGATRVALVSRPTLESPSSRR
jgi:hypothetical protein